MKKIDILIPTFNRAIHLKKNFDLLERLIIEENVGDYFKIFVSDNCSTDNTQEIIANKIKSSKIIINNYRTDENIGLEKNAIFILEKATADYVMYIGDDDYIPDGYLTFVVNTIDDDKNVSAIIPGFSALFVDGSIKSARQENFEIRRYPPSFHTVSELSHFGHQLSGVVFKREGLLEKYLNDETLRNIYPFILFNAFNNLRGNSYYAPKFKVLVSQGNQKDWKYDDSGLLIEIFKNYKILYPESTIKRDLLCISMMLKQPWRLRVGKNFFNAGRAFWHLFKTREVDLWVKLSLIGLYPYLYVKGVFFLAKKRLFP